MRPAIRRPLALLSVLAIGLGISALRAPGALAAASCTTTASTNYTVQVCITAPSPMATLTGPTTVSATATITGGSATLSFISFTLNGAPLASAFVPTTYSFTWHTAHWVDGSYTLGAYASMSDGTNTLNSPAPGGPATETVTLANGVATAPVNNNQPTITSGTTPAAGQPLVVGAVGSGADGSAGSNAVGNEVAGWSPNLFLFLGDVYERATYEEFYNWYDPSWGKIRSVTNPVPGDQESYYGLDGYHWYWNNLPDYYSFDAGGWHFIALTGCQYATNLCNSSGGPEITWLNNDLAAHAGACTIAYWHEPRWALWSDPNPGLDEQPLWNALASNHVTATVNADRHFYERWTALDASGNATPTGTAEFVVGTGGHNFDGPSGSDSRVVTTITSTPGALKLSISRASAAFQFISSSGTVGDSGTIPCQGNGTLSGTVTDAGSGSPIAGATVAYSGTGPGGPISGSATTDNTGHYSVTGLAVTSYNLTAQASGYQSQSGTATINGGATTTQSFALTSLATTLTGTVTDNVTGTAIAGATITAGTASATSNSSGAYTITGLAPGTYTATASATNYAGQSASVTLTAGSTTTQNFALAPNPATISGTVTNAANAAPIAGATVSYSGGSATTDTNGNYTLANVTEGTYTLTASASGFQTQSKAITLGPGASSTQSFAMSALSTTLSGTVTDSVTGTALAGATVTAGTASATTSSSGAYTITGLAPGSYTATAASTNYASQSASVTLTAGSTTTQNFALAPNPATITGTVTNATTAAPIAGATVSYSGGSATTDSSGNYTLANVTEGTYTLTASASGFQTQTRSVTVGPGASSTQNFAMTLNYGSITGTVTDAGNGAAISGATVAYSGGSATTNASGQYTLANVAPGNYTVTASATGYSAQTQSLIVASGGTATANFAMRLAPFFSDGFESGSFANWNTSAGLSIETSTVHTGSYAAEGSTINGTTYAMKQLGTTYSDLYYRTYFDLKSQSTGFTLIGEQSANGTGIIRLYMSPQGQLVLWNDVTQLTTTGPTVSANAWHSVELHVTINGTMSATEVWLDGAPVSAFSTTQALGLLPVGQIQLGSQASLQIYDVVFDDVALSTSRIGQ